MIAIDLGDDSQVLQQGEIVLMGGELQVVLKFQLLVSMGLTVIAQKGGTIAASWSIMGNTGPTDYLTMEICDSSR